MNISSAALVSLLKAVLVLTVILTWSKTSQYKYCSYETETTVSCFGTGYTCSGPPTCGHVEYIDNQCTSEASSSCLCWNWFTTLFVIILCFASAASIETIMWWRYGETFNPRMDMVWIAESHVLDSDKMTRLLHPALCAVSLFEFGAICMTPVALIVNDVSCATIQESGVIPFTIFLIVLELMTCTCACRPPDMWRCTH